MDHHRSLPRVAVVLASFWVAGPVTSQDGPPLRDFDRPNIVLILADDFGYGSSGCYGADPDLIRTPSIDRLAHEGRRFTDANTPSSVCTPTRYALLTGRYCWRTPLNHGGVANTLDPLLIDPSRDTLASMLKRHGYATGIVGKWHLGYGVARRVDYTKELRPGPLELGFDYQFAVPQNHNDVTRVFVENHHVFGLRSTRLTPTKGNLGLDAPQREDTRTMEQLTDRAVAWLRTQSSDSPFFLYFAPVAVHELITPSRHTAGSSQAGPYGDFIHDLDGSVGRILDTLDDLKKTNSTLVVFTSDNGGVIAEKSKSGSQKIAIDAGLKINRDWRGGKHDIWEGGFRVPFIVRWPGQVAPGTTSHQMIGIVDLFATVAAVVGEEPLDRPTTAPDSHNQLPVFTGPADTKSSRPDLILQSANGVYAIRSGPWKWIEGIPQPRREGRLPGKNGPKADQFRPRLINLEDDPGELRDVAQQYPDVVKRLARTLRQHREQNETARPKREGETSAEPKTRKTQARQESRRPESRFF